MVRHLRSLPQFAPAQRPQSRRRLRLERLEDRAMLSTISLAVNMLADDPLVAIPGQTTLRDAINTADGGAITNPTNQYVITFKQGLTGTIDLTQSLPPLAANITIKGPGASNLTVQRDASAVQFYVFTVDSGETINLSGITISGGNAGDGIFNDGTLTVTNSIFTNNGDGIYNEDTLTVSKSIFTDGGSGIYNFGTATVNNSVFSGNSIGGGLISFGGGLSNVGGILTVIGSTFTDNSATVGGGLNNAAGFDGNLGTATVIDSTFSNNFAFDDGGIFHVEGSTITIIGGTFANNSADYSGGGFGNEGVATVIGSTFTNNSADYGGGIVAQIGTTTVIGSIFVNNSAEYGGAIDNGLFQPTRNPDSDGDW